MSSKAPILGSFAATAAILAGGFWYVNHRQTSHHESPPPPTVAGSPTDLAQNQTTRIEPLASPEVPTAPGIEMSDVVAVALESIASRSQGRMKSAEENAHQDDLSRRIAALNPVQLENLVAELATCDALARDEKGWWIMMSLNSMAEADLEKALAVWKANVGTIKGSIWVAGSLSTLIGKFATKSPTKAFAKLQEAAAVAPGINVAQVTTNVVQTIARSDFATALGLMESHIEPLGPTAVRDVLSVAMMPSNGDRFLEITRYMNGYLTRCKNPAAGEELERNLLSSIGSSLAPKLGYQETERWMHQAGLSRQQYLAM